MSSRIEDVKEPVIGKFYMVPCIEHAVYSGVEHLPVIGSWHEDKEIVGFDAFHFHYDWRFMPSSVFYRYANTGLNHGRVATRKPDDPLWPPNTEFPVTHRRRKMLRQMPDFPSYGYTGAEVPFVRKLEEKYSDHVLKCRTCPHRGMSLDGLPTDDRGRVVCNGHGLRWNLNTGKLAPRLIDDPKDPRQVKE